MGQNSLNSVNSENPLKHELGPIQLSSLLVMSLWSSGRVSVSHAGDSGFESGYLFKIIIFFVTEFSESI